MGKILVRTDVYEQSGAKKKTKLKLKKKKKTQKTEEQLANT